MLKINNVSGLTHTNKSINFGTNKLVYVCSSLASDYNPENKENIDFQTHIRMNMQKAIGYSKKVVANGDIPILLHDKACYLADDTNPKEREMILNAGRELVKRSDALCVFGKPIGGMIDEIKLAKKNGIPVITPEQLPEIDAIVEKTPRFQLLQGLDLIG